jgi:hypothetical protein
MSGRLVVEARKIHKLAVSTADEIAIFPIVLTRASSLCSVSIREVFAQTPTPSVQNAARLAPTPLSRIFDNRILEKRIAVTSGVVVVTRKTSLP